MFPLTHNRCEVVISWWSPSSDIGKSIGPRSVTDETTGGPVNLFYWTMFKITKIRWRSGKSPKVFPMSASLPKISIYATKCESILEKSGIFIHLQSKYCINLSCKKNLTISWVQIAARWLFWQNSARWSTEVVRWPTSLIIETVSPEGTFCDTVQVPSNGGDKELI